MKTPTTVDAIKTDVLKTDTAKTDALKGTPVGEQPAPAAQTETEIPVEDLPPLEYAELQAASRRRRRRRTNGTNANAVTPTSLIRSATQPTTCLSVAHRAGFSGCASQRGDHKSRSGGDTKHAANSIYHSVGCDG